MKALRVLKLMLCLILAAASALSAAGCAMRASATDLMAGVTPREVTAEGELSAKNGKAVDFAVRLFRASDESGKNTLVSPLSVMSALAMTANGAEGETLRQMENVLGMTVQELNLYLYSYKKSLPSGEKYRLGLANSIWLKEGGDFLANEEFLQTNADYYGADIYEAPFDSRTCRDINEWVKKKTDGMIPEILDRISEYAVMYLVNALSFEAEWDRIYETKDVRDGKFKKEDGTEQDVEFMYCDESKYLEDEKATGFLKYYSGGKYAFAALLPNEGVTVSEYVASLDGESLYRMLSTPENTNVLTAIPKFEVEYDVEMSDILAGMGMPEAFDSDHASFGRLGEASSNLYMSEVLHRTFISVGEKGTKAGAATVVEIDEAGSAYVEIEEPKRVYLDRPFVYMLIDCQNNVPFFIGTLVDAAGT